MCDVVEPFCFWQILPNQATGIFIQPMFPGIIRMGKIDIGRERLGHFLMLGKLPTIVISDGVNLTPLRGEYGLNGLSDLFSLFGFRFG